MTGECGVITFVVARAPTEVSTAAEPRCVFWGKLDDAVDRIPEKGDLFVVMAANTRTERRR